MVLNQGITALLGGIRENVCAWRGVGVIKTEGYRTFVLGMKEKKCEIFWNVHGSSTLRLVASKMTLVPSMEKHTGRPRGGRTCVSQDRLFFLSPHLLLISPIFIPTCWMWGKVKRQLIHSRCARPRRSNLWFGRGRRLDLNWIWDWRFKPKWTKMFITEREQKVTKDVKEWEMEIQLNTRETNNF